MAIKRFTKMEYKNADEMVFGDAKYPISYGFGQKIGAGHVVPEINFAPRPEAAKNPETLTREYVDYITKDIMERAVTIGLPAVQLENEHVWQMVNEPKKFEKPVIIGQTAMIEKYHDEYGIATSIRHTIADPRLCEFGMREGQDKTHNYPEKVIEAAEIAAENGASLLSIESMGGKEMSDYGIMNGDIRAWLFGIGYLGALDMEWLWPQLVDICKKNKVVAGGDTNCAGANTSMFMAGGYLDKDVARTFAAVTRCIASTRTLIALECGATGPDKDCGYEGPILKAISGRPSAQEGKNCTCAHNDLMGNLTAQVCDLWSNESVEYHPEFGGSSVQCWLGSIGAEAMLMNAAKQMKQDKVLRDLYMATDRYRSPEAFCIAYDNAYTIGETIVEYGKDRYLRAKMAGLKAAELIQASAEKGAMKLSKQEKDTLNVIIRDLTACPDDEDKFVALCLKEYKNVPGFNPKNYGL
ncbi:MAG: methanol--corrinoid methyltransferase [Methanomassiliicoccales archaeon]|nr:methanol--corrinoid methyltransferase [Methanomassiliicoccales archaeon]